MPFESAITSLSQVGGVLIDYQDLRKRFGEDELTRIFDQANEGIANTQAVQGCVRDAEAEIIGYIGIHNPAEVAELPATAHTLLKTYALELFEAYAATRLTSFGFNFDPEERKRSVRTQLDRLKRNELLLVGKTPPTNAGEEARVATEPYEQTEESTWSDWGGF
jgi:hypothetical protein